MTVDVESFSIPLNRCDPETARQVYDQGLPRLLAVLAKHDAASTFYFTGELAQAVPEAIELVKDHGHEIGCHGHLHEVDRAFDILSYDEQVHDLTTAKKIIESVAGPIQAFRAPALRINDDTIRALAATRFTTDSSVCPQRFDGPFTFGSKQKLKWLTAPRGPHYLDGDQSILEIPVSALLVPYIGTTMRISPLMVRLLQEVLFFEAAHTGRPVVFLFHPNECLDTRGNVITTRRTNNRIKYLFADKIRQRLKLRNLGEKAVVQMDGILHHAKECGFSFMTASDLMREYRVKE
ncbi:polysaccharide deacetylase family protein [Methanocalculus sp.]|uniref:polysaccharide deacetylase family protein n=1 Tax=Methanocalculus sp. TaxID=2004547 RepID=UPI002629E606|nr:polysaccharide deacetylase family protein [Methanocalculus sp.]MDG6250465.1 polysaccharide deacetylase family protein [Methanocalculus sp.]